jgi:hypothetical protein
MSDPFSDQMAADHRRDYEAHRLLDDAQRALRACWTDGCRLNATELARIAEVQQMLEKRAAHIVRVWD